MHNEDKITKGLLRALAVTFGITILFIPYWNWPRDIIDIEIAPTMQAFESHDLIFDAVITPRGAGNSIYERTISCGPQRFFVSTIEAVSNLGESRTTQFEIKAPAVVPRGTDCILVIESRHEVNVLPFIRKTIDDRFESSSFQITGQQQ